MQLSQATREHSASQHIDSIYETMEKLNNIVNEFVSNPQITFSSGMRTQYCMYKLLIGKICIISKEQPKGMKKAQKHTYMLRSVTVYVRQKWCRKMDLSQTNNK